MLVLPVPGTVKLSHQQAACLPFGPIRAMRYWRGNEYVAFSSIMINSNKEEIYSEVTACQDKHRAQELILSIPLLF
jgi:hypothetical protein